MRQDFDRVSANEIMAAFMQEAAKEAKEAKQMMDSVDLNKEAEKLR